MRISRPLWHLIMAGTVLSACSVPPTRTVSLGVFEETADIGGPGITGSATWDPSTDRYTVAGSGENMWFDRDGFRFVWRRVSGDFVIRTRVAFAGEGGHEHRKAGLMARATLDTSAAYVDAVVHAGDGLAALQYRLARGAETSEIRSMVASPDVIELRRSGGTFTTSFARFGRPPETTTVEHPSLPDELFVGLLVCSHDSTRLETAVFSQVRIVRPAPTDFQPYRDYLGSRLEILDTRTGDREIVHTDPGSIQAPNWTPDGSALLFNRSGLLYRFDLASGDTTRIETGFATNNNNDHVLTLDGTMLGISHHVAEESNTSIIFTLPATGGEPRRVTGLGPSYLHGWSPDNRFLVYTALRGDDYDIWRIAAEGGVETRLTDSPGLDDGPEYTPDGSWIWFNSVRSGTMQLWRMRPDGSGAEQMTDDDYNNWFPHVSPDGSQIAYLSFTPDVPPGDHPFYRHVTLRVMPASGGSSRVVAYVYGGQGTMNVPSWAPDSRRLAFVSNTGSW